MEVNANNHVSDIQLEDETPRFSGSSKRGKGSLHSMPLETPRDIKNYLCKLAKEVIKGKVETKVASCVGNLMNIALRAIESGEFDERLEKLEQYAESQRQHHAGGRRVA